MKQKTGTKHVLPNGVRISSVEALKDAIRNGNTEFAIKLNGGLVSVKTITLRTSDVFRVEHHIDGEVESLTEGQLTDPEWSNIGEAIHRGAFIAYGR